MHITTKRALAAVLIAVMFFSLAACRDKKNDPADPTLLSNPVTEEPKVTLADLKDKLREAAELDSFCKLSSDGMSLEAKEIRGLWTGQIKKINSLLGFSDSVITLMQNTSANDGMQTKSSGDFTATWTVTAKSYLGHDELIVIYEINQ